ncbi:MAG: cytochrome c oxidase subunit 3 [Myxococcota bacterium]
MSGEDRPHLEVVQGGAHQTRFEREVSAGQLGLWILLASLGMLFAATVVGFLIIRYRTDGWAQGLPGLPVGLLWSTGIILGASVTLFLAVRAARRGEASRLVQMLWASLALAIAFMVAQAINWLDMVQADMPPNTANLYAFTFYLLTGTHAAHVLGGLIPLSITLRNAIRGRYSATQFEGVSLTAQYWHFLDIVWLILLGVMWGTT